MAKSFLRSGNLDAVLALGENGQPVYASALPLRETLRLRNQAKIADCLAIPQPDERGERIDWYAPFSGKVKSWIAASDSERTAAIHLLASYQSEVDAISQRAQSEQKPAMRLFGILLSKVFQFPDQNYLYLVDGKPVITFWGFVDLDKKPRVDALDCLRATLKVTPPPLLPIEIAPQPMVALKAAEPEPQVMMPEPQKKLRLWRRAGWLLLPLAIASALVGYQYAPSQASSEPVVDTAKPPVTPPVTVTETPKTPVAVSDEKPAAPVPSVDRPEAPKIAESLSEKPVKAVADIPAADDLVMPADAVKLGSTQFLNGRWRVTLETNNLPTGKPPSLRYQIKNGAGSARITQGDGIRCKADIAAGLMSSGNLVINSRYTARCSDGSRYKMPEIVCKATGGAAGCEARYGTETVFPMTMKRETQ
ncbi:SrfA family protein [Winslowiella iniecta]|uniref:SrfA n=1 Tax=Winslowiella iniecta TaxID=1560201 RepID=A0A0L7TJ17_9GAMM|nr:SrfA family protein [Winslowiella iniecta]KOC89294.1 SrfA [Winslowiella iniecta]KOC95347.1 SrfA [Winslowiella iniecta]